MSVPRAGAVVVVVVMGWWCSDGSLTDVDAVVIPVCARHVLVDVGVDSGHACDSRRGDAQPLVGSGRRDKSC